MVHELTNDAALDAITDGFILNFYSSPGGSVGNTIHPFNCHHIERMSTNYRKVWGETPEELEAWVHQQGASLDPSAPRCRYV